MADEVLCAIDGSIATVTLNRPDRRNALDRATLEGLAAVFARLEGHDDVRVVVLRGAGPAFCSGRDLKEMRDGQDRGADPGGGILDVLRRIEASRHPTIAMVQGDAYAGGCELALHCDLRVAAEPARFAMPLVRIGLVVPFALGQKLVEIVGPAHARRILLTGQPVSARQAWEIGMVHEVVAATQLEATTGELARTVAASAPLALAGTKAAIQRAIALRATIAHADLDEQVTRARRSADAREGVRAVLEKRAPVFRGE